MTTLGRASTAAPPVAWLSTLLSLAILASAIPTLLQVAALPNWNGYGGIDYAIYMEAATRWLEAGAFYLPHQFAGPYPVVHGVVLYPPVSLLLFVPFTFLPAILWWAIPLGVTGWVLWRLRPGPLAWPLMACVVAWQPVQIHVISGNPDLWVIMALSLATLYRWPAVFVFLKPSIAIFALFGVWDRRWWYGLAVFCALSLPFLPMWFDWLTVVLNSRSGGGLLYSWQEAPMMLLPLIAWVCRPAGRYGLERGRAVDDAEPAHAELLVRLDRGAVAVEADAHAVGLGRTAAR